MVALVLSIRLVLVPFENVFSESVLRLGSVAAVETHV